MALQPREKKLAGVVAGLLGLLLVYWGIGRFWAAIQQRTARISALESEIRDKQARERNGALAALRLADFEARSLPTERELARTLYQNWLVDLADRADLTEVQIDSSTGAMYRNLFYRIPFSIRGQGSLSKVVDWLYNFSRSGHLHRIRDLSIRPLERSSQVELNLAIEALVLAGADRNDKLTSRASTALEHPSLDDYRKPIVERNFFAAYVPPPPPKPPVVTRRPDPPPPQPPPPPKFDPARHVVLTAIIQVDEQPQAWLSVRTTGDVLKVKNGDPLEVGQFKGRVVAIHDSNLILEADGQRRRLELGKSLPQATEMDDAL